MSSLGLAENSAAIPARRRFRLSSYQRDVWLAATQLPDNPQFVWVVTVTLCGPVNIALLQQSSEAAFARHDLWLLRLGDDEDGPHQWLAEEGPGVTVVDLRGEADPDVARDVQLAHMRSSPMSLSAAPMVEACVLRTSDTETVLAMRFHHACADGITSGLVIDEILGEYLRRLGHDRAVPPPSQSYVSFVEKERAYLESPDVDFDREYFRQALDGHEPAVFSRRRDSGDRTNGRHTFEIDATTVAAIRDLGVTPAACLLAAMGVFLSRFHRTPDVVIGVPFANRAAFESPHLWGLCANMLPLRLRMTEATTLRELVVQATAALREMRTHERLALGDLIRAVAPAGPSPQLFDVTLSAIRLPEPVQIPDVTHRTHAWLPPHDADALAILMRSYPGVEEIFVDFGYADDVFDETLPIAAVAEAVLLILRGGLDAPDAPLSSVSWLTAAQTRRLHDIQFGPTTPIERGTIHGHFERQAKQSPQALAIIAPDGSSMTYAELDERADEVAAGLAAEGVGPGQRVAIMMRRGAPLMIALFGVLKAGAAYVPIDPAYPAERIRYLLTDCGAEIVLVDEPSAESTAESTGRLTGRGSASAHGGPTAWTIAEIASHAAEGNAPSRGQVAEPEDAAYVIYTSGSTGRPKGVVVRHRSVINRLAWMQHDFPIGPGSVLLQKTPISFDVSVWELFWWSWYGAALALLDPGAEKDPLAVLAAVRKNGVTAVHFVPSMLGPFLAVFAEDLTALEAVATLRYVFCRCAHNGAATPVREAAAQETTPASKDNGSPSSPRTRYGSTAPAASSSANTTGRTGQVAASPNAVVVTPGLP